MKEYRNLTRPELEAELAAVRAEYDALKAKGLQLNHNDAGGKRSQACSCVPPQKPAQVQPDIRPFSMPFSCVAICPAMRKRLRVREIKHTVRGRNNHGKTKT